MAAVKTYEEWNTEAEKFVLEKDDKDDSESNTTIVEDNEDVCTVLCGVAGLLISKKDLDTYQGKYNNAVKLIKENKDTKTVDFDISYELQSVSQSSIDYLYLVSLIQKYIVGVEEDAIQSISDPAIDNYIQSI